MKALNWVFLVILLCSFAACKQSKTKQDLVDKATELESAVMFLDPAGFRRTIEHNRGGFQRTIKRNRGTYQKSHNFELKPLGTWPDVL